MNLTAGLLLIPLLACCASVALVLPVLVRIYRACRTEDVTPEWLGSFSPANYYPMADLLADDDFRFLARQPGFDLSLYKKLRRERLIIFKQYLNRLILDFNRLHAVIREIVAHASEDQSGVLVRLMRLRFLFSLAVVYAYGSYLLCCLGFRTLAVRAMILRLEEMHAQLVSISNFELA